MDKRSLRLKRLFEESEKSYVELEKMTGIKKSSLQRYASGATKKIPLYAIEKIATAFAVPASYLMGWDDSTPKDDQDAVRQQSADRLAMIELVNSLPDEQVSKLLAVAKAVLGQ